MSKGENTDVACNQLADVLTRLPMVGSATSKHQVLGCCVKASSDNRRLAQEIHAAQEQSQQVFVLNLHRFEITQSIDDSHRI